MFPTSYVLFSWKEIFAFLLSRVKKRFLVEKSSGKLRIAKVEKACIARSEQRTAGAELAKSSASDRPLDTHAYCSLYMAPHNNSTAGVKSN